MVRKNDLKSSVLIDFGLAEFCDNSEYLRNRCGTPGYISPEVMESKEMNHIDPKCDVFSAGVTFFVMLTKRSLFNAATQEEAILKNKNCEFILASEEI